MKYLKLIGLAAVAAMALMAFIGAGSASATALCSTTPTTTGENIGECPSGWDYAAGTEIHAELEGNAILETLGGTELAKCTVGTIQAHTTNTGSTTETVEAKITALTWGAVGAGCNKTVDTLKTGHLIIHTDVGDDHNGLVTATTSEVTVNTIFGSCIYGTGAERSIGTLTHSTATEPHATIDINTTVLKVGGNAACPTETRWTASYTVTSPKPLYVATGVE